MKEITIKLVFSSCPGFFFFFVCFPVPLALRSYTASCFSPLSGPAPTLNPMVPLSVCSSKQSLSEKGCVFLGPLKHVLQPMGFV